MAINKINIKTLTCWSLKIANKFFFEVCTSTKKGRLPKIINIIATKRILSLLKKAKELS